MSAFIPLFFSTLKNSFQTLEQVNDACTKQGLPSAFQIDDSLSIKGNTDYRFEGFGLAFSGFPPKPQLTFYVHYKMGTPQAVALGKFSVPLTFTQLANLDFPNSADVVQNMERLSEDATESLPSEHLQHVEEELEEAARLENDTDTHVGGPETVRPTQFAYAYPPVTYGQRSFIVTIPPEYIQKALSNQDYAIAAAAFGIDVAVLRAVVDVEASGSGFLLQEPPPARPKILFEAHQFYRLTPKPVSKVRRDLSCPTWKEAKIYYKGGVGEWGRLLDAMEFDPIAAMKSASWGLGQIIGFNHKLAGCSTVEQLIVEAHQGEYQQLQHILNFCRNANPRMIPALKQYDWKTFALAYNGSGALTHGYHTRLANRFAVWKRRLA